MNDNAPIILFVYNRLDHTKKTIDALLANERSKDSDIIIYSDGPKEDFEKANVDNVRSYIETIKGFRSIVIKNSSINMGLAASIISGVSEIIDIYGKAIILEDDIVTSPYFLEYMNITLDKFKEKKDIWSISGWNYPLKKKYPNEIYLTRIMNCWGWATWKDRWFFFKKDTDYFLDKFTRKDIYRFNLDGRINFWNQMIANKNGELNTWAIYWYATIFYKNGLCLNPVKSYVENIGFDGSGTHHELRKRKYPVSFERINNYNIVQIKEDKKIKNEIKKIHPLKKHNDYLKILRKEIRKIKRALRFKRKKK